MNQESTRITEALRTTTVGEKEVDKPLSQMVHDIQNCLQVIGLGTELLKGARNDDARFAEVSEGIDRERLRAVRILDEYRQSTQQEE